METLDWKPEAAKDDIAQNRQAREAVERRSPQTSGENDGGVGEHHPGDALRHPGRRRGNDRTTPVLTHKDDATKIEALGQLHDRLRVTIDGVVAKAWQAVGETQTEEIGSDTAELVEVLDDTPPEEAPGGVAMEQQHGAPVTRTGLDKVKPATRVAVSRQGQKASMERKERDQKLG